MSFVTVRDVWQSYGDRSILERINLDVAEGEFISLVGASGAGKSTFLRMLLAEERPKRGEITIDGGAPAVEPGLERGVVFQRYSVFPHMTVRENIAYPLDVRKRPRAEIAARVDEMLDLVQLQDFGHRLPRQLSGGQQQRVALARALCFAPPVLLLDEPLGALDKKLRVEVQDQLKDIHRRVGTTFIYVTHDQEEALSMSDRIVIMQKGHIEQVGTPQELYQNPRTAFAASFLGKSNFLTRDGALYALRPEKIDILPRGNGKGPNTVSGTVRAMTYFGSTLKYDVAVPGMDDIEVDVDAWRGGAPMAEGAEVDLSWSDTAAVRFESD